MTADVERRRSSAPIPANRPERVARTPRRAPRGRDGVHGRLDRRARVRAAERRRNEHERGGLPNDDGNPRAATDSVDDRPSRARHARPARPRVRTLGRRERHASRQGVRARGGADDDARERGNDDDDARRRARRRLGRVRGRDAARR